MTSTILKQTFERFMEMINIQNQQNRIPDPTNRHPGSRDYRNINRL